MKIYRYNSETKIYENSQKANLDQLETALQGKNIYLLPVNCTFNAPKLEEGKVAVFKDNAWVNIIDNRNKYYYENKQLFEIKNILDEHIPLTDSQLQAIYEGQTVEVLEDGYNIYWTIDQKKERVRRVRNDYLEETDKFISIPDFPINSETKQLYIKYRQYLRDYPTEVENWWEQEPKTFEEWENNILN